MHVKSASCHPIWPGKMTSVEKSPIQNCLQNTKKSTFIDLIPSKWICWKHVDFDSNFILSFLFCQKLAKSLDKKRDKNLGRPISCQGFVHWRSFFLARKSTASYTTLGLKGSGPRFMAKRPLENHILGMWNNCPHPWAALLCKSFLNPPVDRPKDPWPRVLSLPEQFVGDPASLARDNI